MCAEVSWETHLKEPLFETNRLLKCRLWQILLQAKYVYIGIPVFFWAFSKEVLRTKLSLGKGLIYVRRRQMYLNSCLIKMASALKLEKREASKTCRPPVFEENTVQVWLFTLLEHLSVISQSKKEQREPLWVWPSGQCRSNWRIIKMCMSSFDSTPNTFRELIAFLQFPSRHYDPKLLFHVIIVVCRLDYNVSFFFSHP